MKVAIIGAGAAGLMCACKISPKHSVFVFDKNVSAGQKLLITGHGRCNITNLAKPKTFLESVLQNSRFLQNSLYEFSPQDTMQFLKEIGIDTHTEDNNRVFPNAGAADAVRDAMEKFAKSRGVKFIFGTNVTGIEKTLNGFTLTIDEKPNLFDIVIIATGGISFPITGSTGDGYVFAENLGHKIVKTRPSLCGLKLTEPTNLQGTSVNGGIELLNETGILVTKKITGNMLFTQKGVSGPVIFEMAAKFKQQTISGHFLQIDFAPNLSFKELEETLFKLLTENPKKQLVSIVHSFVPHSVAKWVLKTAKLDITKTCNQITKTERSILLASIRSNRVLIKNFEDIKFATITRGGVDVSEVNPKTMESKLVSNLFFIGEVLDVDALSGGFNLQIAFSTAAAAARALSINS